VALVAGCATVASKDGAAPVRPLASDITGFSVAGRISVRHGESRYSAHLTWRHEPVRDEILLTNPLGQGIAEVVRDDNGARLTLADRREYAAADWEQLSERIFGVRLPLGALPHWVVGDTRGQVAGWRMEILEREDAALNPLPTLMDLSGADTEVRLKIDEWSEVR